MTSRATVSWQLRNLAIGLVAASIVACGAKREPLYIDPGLAEAETGFETIAFMPVIDVRPDPFAYVGISNQARHAGTRLLTRKGYTVVPTVVSTPEHRIASGELAKMTENELADLGPPDSEMLMFIYVEKLERDFDEHGEASRVTVSGILVSKAAKEAIWRDRAVGDSNMIGLFTVLSGPSTEYEAVYQALRILFATIPDRKKS